jgi:hypothetical protein
MGDGWRLSPAFLHAPLPRVKCRHCGKVTQVEVPWARPGSGFTLLMDALVLTLAKKFPVSAIGAGETGLYRQSPPLRMITVTGA